MSVPENRMVRPSGDPNKILGVKKPIFWAIMAAGAIFAIWLYLRSKKSASSSDANQGLTAADIGGTPSDNSFATNTDALALEEQLQQLQLSLSQLRASNGGNGGGLNFPGNPSGEGGDSTFTSDPTSPVFIPGNSPIDTYTVSTPASIPYAPGAYSPVPPKYNPVTAPVRARVSDR